ncbi:prolipoprotein diacylglyceryl transferase [Patescibacteria group bacterium]|nr:prolipoprotein diacylglyceryl transferase [Patescibacteria group bacterium]MBU1663391.1 prolipoprotein diacylglyceryl transferase [Patescibacteria group bacterium]MBU1933748.1 prolipoprotein diacylglyceryl transferase [Patescibacteria group bacterium]MBU2008045.1 prolipoprotein diacylglyceryl transferase [Patescibacteria group bacterium]MBU2233739.1 prolipoprotein diacylglyceryl transferase [Patescibacteria group bacterium]
MFNLLHTFNPSPVIFSFGSINIYWYGVFMVIGVLAAMAMAIYLAKLYGIKSEIIIDMAVWLIIGGIIGARLYDIFLEWPYFSTHLINTFKIWHGGLAIHGAIIGGLVALWLFAKIHHHNFWPLAAIAATALPLAQAIGRWGNYFNQELFGYPTDLPWGIWINIVHRPLQYLNYNYFHPAFFYESMGNLLIFIILIFLQMRVIKKQRFSATNYILCVASYAFLYSLLRFFTEFIRIDATPVVFGLRFPQLVSLLMMILALIFIAYKIWPKINRNNTQSVLDN